QQLMEMAIARTEALDALLGRVRDDQTAQELRPAAERCFIEMSVVAARLQMMGPPTETDRFAVAPLAERFFRARQTLQAEAGRIAGDTTMLAQLKTVVFPIHQNFAGEQNVKTRSLTSQLQTVRSQVELYKLQHRDRLPTFRVCGWKQLTSKT